MKDLGYTIINFGTGEVVQALKLGSLFFQLKNWKEEEERTGFRASKLELNINEVELNKENYHWNWVTGLTVRTETASSLEELKNIMIDFRRIGHE